MIRARVGLVCALTAALAVAVGSGAWAAQPAPAAGPAPASESTDRDATPPFEASEPVGPPETSTAAAPPGAPGPFDLGGRVGEAMTGWFRDLVASALDPTLELLAATVLATPQVTGPGRVRELWGVSAGIAAGFHVLLVIVGGIVLASHGTLQTRYTVKEIAPRAVVGLIAGSVSLTVAGQAISAANALSAALMGQGLPLVAVMETLERLLLSPMFDGGVFLALVGVGVAVLTLALAVTCLVRIALVTLLVAGAPLALACHALPHTERLAFLWWKGLGACLGAQVGQALTLITGMRVFFDPAGRDTLGLPIASGLVDLLVVVTLLWVMVRIPIWAGRVMLTGRGGIVRMAQYYVTARIFRKLVVRR